MSRRVVSSERMFEGKLFNVDRDRLLDASTGEVIREIVRHPGGAGGLPLFDDRSVALVRQYRHAAGRELLEIPAGLIEPGETPETCARREIEAEIGERPGRMDLISSFYSTPGFCEERIHIYLATDLSPSRQSLDEDEEVEILRMPLEEAVELVKRGAIEDAKTIIALLAASASRH